MTKPLATSLGLKEGIFQITKYLNLQVSLKYSTELPFINLNLKKICSTYHVRKEHRRLEQSPQGVPCTLGGAALYPYYPDSQGPRVHSST